MNRLGSLRPLTLAAFAFVVAALLAGILLGGIWPYVAFAGLMVVMHLFGHGGHGHGASHDEHTDHEEEADR